MYLAAQQAPQTTVHWDIPAILVTLVMLFAIYRALLRPHPPAASGLGNLRAGAFLVAGLGLATFFMPLIRTNPAVMGRTQWSGANIGSELVRGSLDFSPVAFDIVCGYLLLLVALVALCFPRPRKALLVTSLFGVMCSNWALQMSRYSLFDWFVKASSGLQLLHIANAPAMYALSLAMSLLLLISVSAEP